MAKRSSGSRIARFSIGRGQVLLVLVVLLPLLLVQSGIYWAWFHSRLDEELQSNLEMAAAVAASFQDYVRDVLRQERSIGSALAGLRPYSQEEANWFLLAGATDFVSVRSMSYVSAEGQVLASSDTHAIGMGISGQDYFRKILKGQEWVLTNLLEAGTAHGSAMFVARRVLNPDGSLAGAIVAELDATRLGQRALAIHRSEGGGFALFDRAGRMIFSSLPQEQVHLNWLDDDQMLAPALAGQVQSGMFVYPTDRAEHLTAHVPVFNLNSPDEQEYYVVLASRPEALALSEVYQNLGLVAAINLLVIGISLVGAAFLGRRMTVPLRRLLEHTQSIGRGDLQHRTEIRAVAELDELAEAMNRMAADLQEARRQEEQARAGLEEANDRLRQEVAERGRAEEALQRSRDELEQRVRERTMDLSRTVEALREEIARRALAEEQLRTANAILETRKAQLQRLASELTLAEQREQHRLAQILHDELQQLLVAAKFRLAFMQQTRSDALRRTATDVVGLIDQSIETSSSLTAQLSPPALYEGGLISALQWLTRWMGEKHHLEVALTVDGNIRFTAREDMTVLLFRAVRELLFNVVKHSAVREARVEISGLDSQIRVIVADSGIGFDPSRLPATRGVGGGFGLLSVRERLDILGGRMEIESAPGRGSRFTLLAPIGEDVPL